MLWTLFVILLVLWLLGVVSSYTFGGFIHILLVLAVIALVFQLISGRRCKFVTASAQGNRSFLKGIRIAASRQKRSTCKMDKDRVEGKIKDIKGRVERQVGEWTGDKDAQAEGTKEQIKGKVQNAFGKIKDAGRDALNTNKQRTAWR